METTYVTAVDARVRGGMLTICEFAGRKHSPAGHRKCKLFEEASRDQKWCMYYREDTGHCDCTK